MSVMDPIGQQLPEEATELSTPTRIETVVRSLEDNRASVHRWFWKGLLAFNLLLGSLVFWLSIVPRHV